MIDYKINNIIDNGIWKEITYSVYSGDISIENEKNISGVLTPTKRYRRNNKLFTKKFITNSDNFKGELNSEISKLGHIVIQEQSL